MHVSREQWTSRQSAEVVGSDGETVGEVVTIRDNYFVVATGFSLPTDYFIPATAISNVEDDKVHLNVTREQALAQAPFRARPSG